MDIDAVSATAIQAAQQQSQVSMAVAAKLMEMQKSDGDQMMQLLQRAMGVGQKVNVTA